MGLSLFIHVADTRLKNKFGLRKGSYKNQATVFSIRKFNHDKVWLENPFNILPSPTTATFFARLARKTKIAFKNHFEF